MSQIKKKFTLNCILFFCIFALSLAYFIQYILNHQPCNLCLIERIPYLAGIILISLIFILGKYENLITIILTLFFIFGFITSIYHVGIEQGIFSETLICDIGKSKTTLSSSELLMELKAKVISCKDVTFKLFGVSLATLNTIISLFLSVILIRNIINYE